MNTDFKVEREIDMLDPVVKHKIEHALLIVKGARADLSPSLSECTSSVWRKEKEAQGFCFQSCTSSQKNHKAETVIVVTLLHACAKSTYKVHSGRESVNILYWYIGAWTVPRKHGTCIDLCVLNTHVYKYLNSSICAVGLNTGAICHNTDNVLIYVDFSDI